jgi:hypothetical protein
VVARKNRKSFGKHVNSRLRTDKGGVQTHFYMISPKFLECTSWSESRPRLYMATFIKMN